MTAVRLLWLLQLWPLQLVWLLAVAGVASVGVAMDVSMHMV